MGGDPNRITLPSGKVIYAYGGIIGIDAGGNIFEGYDGYVDDSGLSLADRLALIDTAIKRWTELRARLAKTASDAASAGKDEF